MSERIKLSEERAEELAWGGDEEFELVTEIHDEPRRWTRTVTAIVRRLEDDKLFRFQWEAGLTEMQEHSFYGCELVEVERKERVITEVYYEEVAA